MDKFFVFQLLSAAEDSLVRVWHLNMTPETNSVEVRGFQYLNTSIKNKS